jgi:hypothetical protein
VIKAPEDEQTVEILKYYKINGLPLLLAPKCDNYIQNVGEFQGRVIAAAPITSQ